MPIGIQISQIIKAMGIVKTLFTYKWKDKIRLFSIYKKTFPTQMSEDIEKKKKDPQKGLGVFLSL